MDCVNSLASELVSLLFFISCFHHEKWYQILQIPAVHVALAL